MIIIDCCVIPIVCLTGINYYYYFHRPWPSMGSDIDHQTRQVSRATAGIYFFIISLSHLKVMENNLQFYEPWRIPLDWEDWRPMQLSAIIIDSSFWKPAVYSQPAVELKFDDEAGDAGKKLIWIVRWGSLDEFRLLELDRSID